MCLPVCSLFRFLFLILILSLSLILILILILSLSFLLFIFPPLLSPFPFAPSRIQIMQLFKTIFESVGLELWLRPYRVIANRSGADKTIGGIIECVPNAQSRAEMGQATGVSLRQHFLNKYAMRGSCGLGVDF